MTHGRSLQIAPKMSKKGDRKLALERLETEAKMDMSTELLTARAAYFEALDTGDEVRFAAL
jgi:hypothetical protein